MAKKLQVKASKIPARARIARGRQRRVKQQQQPKPAATTASTSDVVNRVPVEIWERIADCLPAVEDVCAMALSCKLLHQCASPAGWLLKHGELGELIMCRPDWDRLHQRLATKCDDCIATAIGTASEHLDWQPATFDRFVMQLVGQPALSQRAIGHALNAAAGFGRTRLMEFLLEHPCVDPAYDDSEVLVMAVQGGHLPIVKRLMRDGRVNPAAQDNHAVIQACHDGRLDILDLLVKDARVDLAAQDNTALRLAIAHNHLSIVRRLLRDQRVRTTYPSHQAIFLAACQGHMDVMKLLMAEPGADSALAAQDRAAILTAAKQGHLHAVMERLQLQLDWWPGMSDDDDSDISDYYDDDDDEDEADWDDTEDDWEGDSEDEMVSGGFEQDVFLF